MDEVHAGEVAHDAAEGGGGSALHGERGDEGREGEGSGVAAEDVEDVEFYGAFED